MNSQTCVKIRIYFAREFLWYYTDVAGIHDSFPTYEAALLHAQANNPGAVVESWKEANHG